MYLLKGKAMLVKNEKSSQTMHSGANVIKIPWKISKLSRFDDVGTAFDCVGV